MKCIVGLLLLTVVHFAHLQNFNFGGLPSLGGGFGIPPGVSSKAEACTKSDKDVLVVVEAPTKGRLGAFIQIRKFFTSLLLDTRDCYRMSFLLADEKIVVAKAMNSHFAYKSRIRTLGDRLDNNKPKENVLKIIANILDGAYFEGSKEDSQKIILMVLPGGADSNFPIADKMKSVLEDRSNIIGENGIPELTYAVLAAGIGAWEDEDLTRVTLEAKRTVFGRTWSALDKDEKYGKYSRILKLLKNPNDAGFTGLLASKEQQVFDANTEVVDNSEICRFAVDVAFLVDSSHSIRLDWDKELYFVQRIANRLVIKDGETHAGVIVFSDLGEYTRVYINMTDYKSTEKFNLAVAELPYIGYRTRIDYAFDKLTHELFTPAGGVRSKSIGRLVVLLTDGKQNPVIESNQVFDPVKASKPVVDDGALIVAIGIGNDVNIEQLNNITRDPSRVALVGSVDELISDTFVKSIAKKICETSGKLNVSTPAPVTTTPCPDVTPKKCSGVGSCSNCCGSNDVYINIIQSSGNYLVQGMKAYSDNGQIAGGRVGPVGPEVNTDAPKSTEQIIEMIQKLLPQHKGLGDKLKVILKNNEVGSVGSPSAVRKRRSLNAKDEQSPEQKLLDIAQYAGCRLFLEDLKQDLILDNLLKMAKQGKEYTIFCPTDAAYKKMHQKPDVRFSDRDILLNHIVATEDQNDEGALNLNTQAAGSKVRLSLKSLNKDKVMWKVQQSNILLSLVNRGNFKIMLIDQILNVNTKSIHQTLKRIPQVSIFFKLLQTITLKDTLSKGNIEKICFKSSLCVTLHDSMKSKLNDEFLMPSGFTVLAPTDREMKKLGEKKLKQLHTDKEALVTWLQEHIFIGQFNEDASEHEELLISMGRYHSVLSRVKGMQTKSRGLVMNVMDRLFETKRTLSFRDGFVHIVESL